LLDGDKRIQEKERCVCTRAHRITHYTPFFHFAVALAAAPFGVLFVRTFDGLSKVSVEQECK
jgi:hypothetical protein